MPTQPTPLGESPAIYGQIELLSYQSIFNIMARRDQLGHHTPEIFHQLILIGKNLSIHDFTKVDMRFRETKHIVTNPAGSADTIIMDIPKTDFGFIDQMLKMTVDSKDDIPKKLILEYSSSPNKYEFNATFLIK
jgi:hypothetical protein